MFIGLPASGKTQKAKEILNQNSGNTVRISNDDLRSMFHDGVWSRENERFIDAARNKLIELAMSKKLDVLVDNCNLHPKHEINYKRMCLENNYEFEIEDFRSVPLNECLKRDAVRQNYVTERVIRKMYLQYVAKEPELLVNSNNLPSCIIVDVDGTVALSGERDPYDEDNVDKDEVNWPVVNLIKAYLFKNPSTKMFIFSGRTSACESKTTNWLLNKATLFYNFDLKMRKIGDRRSDWIVKEEIYNEFVKDQFFVDFVMDDRAQVVDLLWRRLGLPCLQVNESEF